MSGTACAACPYTVHAARTVEGETAAQILMTPSCWQRAGMTGIEMGIDLPAALARFDLEAEAHAVRLLLFTPVAGLRVRAFAGDDDDDAPYVPVMSPEAAAMTTMAARRKNERDDDARQE